MRVRNDGAKLTGVVVEAYYNDPRITLDFPDLNSVLIGTQTITVPHGTKTITMPWTVPVGTNSWGEYHWCVGVVIRHANDMALTTVTPRSSNVGMKNFETQPVMAGEIVLTAASNVLQVAAELVVHVDDAALPRGWRAEVLAVAPRPAGQYSAATLRKARLLDAHGILLEPGQTVLVPVRVTPRPGAKRGEAANVRIQAALLPLVAGKRTPLGNGFTYRVVVDKARPVPIVEAGADLADSCMLRHAVRVESTSGTEGRDQSCPHEKAASSARRRAPQREPNDGPRRRHAAVLAC